MQKFKAILAALRFTKSTLQKCLIECISTNVEKQIQWEKRKHAQLPIVPEEHNDEKEAVFICGVTENISEALVAFQSLKNGVD